MKKWWPFWILSACFIGLLMSKSFLLDMQSHLVYGACAFWIGVLWLFGACRNSRFYLEDIFLILYFFFFAGSFIVSQHPFGFIELTTFTMGALVYWTASRFKKELLPGEWVAKILSILTGLFSFFGLVIFFWLPNSRLAGPFQGDFLYSDFPNAMALFLLMMIPLCIYTARNSWFLRGLLFFSFTAFWLTFSRGATMVLLGMSLLSLILLLGSRVSFKKISSSLSWLLPLILLSLAAAYGFNALNDYGLDVSDRLSSEDTSSLQSLNERYEFWKGAIEITKDYPWLGYGPGGFEYIYPSYQEHLLVLSSHPHNLFLKISAESGIPAAVLFALFLGIAGIKALWHFFKSKGENTFLHGVLLISFAGGIAHNLIDYNLNFTLLNFLFFAILGALLNVVRVGATRTFKHLMLGFSLVLFLLVLLQGYGHAHMKDGQYDFLGKEYEEAEASFEKAHFTLFPGHLHELELLLILEREKEEEMDQLLDQLETRYPQFFPYTYYRLVYKYKMGMNTRDALDHLLTLNPNNSLIYYLFLVKSTHARGEIERIAEKILPILEEYTALLSVNMHQTVTTMNPEATEQILEYLLENMNETVDPELYKQVQIIYERFMIIWDAEMKKFNERYDTNLKTWSYDEDFEVLFEPFQ